MATQQKVTEPRLRRWTKEEYYRMAELGFFQNQKAELLEGVIVVSSPQNWLHAATLDRTAEVLRTAFGGGFWVRSQLPLDLGSNTEPEPDVSIVSGKRDDYTAHPQAAVLVVEVSEATLRSDRRNKGSLYARAGIADYWIANLVRTRLEVYRNPHPDPTARYGHAYVDRSILFPGDIVTPLAAPQARIAVSDLLG